MELEIYWLQFAENQLLSIYDYYCEKANVKITQKLVNDIIDTTITLKKHPEKGQVEFLFKFRAQTFRYLIYKNYKIVYWINYDFNRIEIANIFDTRRNPDQLEETKSF